MNRKATENVKGTFISHACLSCLKFVSRSSIFFSTHMKLLSFCIFIKCNSLQISKSTFMFMDIFLWCGSHLLLFMMHWHCVKTYLSCCKIFCFALKHDFFTTILSFVHLHKNAESEIDLDDPGFPFKEKVQFASFFTIRLQFHIEWFFFDWHDFYYEKLGFLYENNENTWILKQGHSSNHASKTPNVLTNLLLE